MNKNGINFRSTRQDFLSVEGIGVKIYPLERVLAGLHIVPDEIIHWKKDQSKIVTVGEGPGDLLPFLISQGLNISALDIWYDSDFEFPETEIGGKMREYITKYSKYLKKGDARRMPFADQSVDVFLSHKLVENFKNENDVVLFLNEVLRVLKKGGEARLQGFLDPSRHFKILELIKPLLADRFLGAFFLENTLVIRSSLLR